MADAAAVPIIARNLQAPDAPRHSALVRLTHWTNTLSFLALLVSGIGILLAHPRFYWGETGGIGTPSLFDLPLPFMLGGPSGWGRYLHFESAWVCVLNGLLYVSSGFASRHFRKDLVRAPNSKENEMAYNTIQRLTYLAVVFVLFPLLIWTGLAMSPAVTSVCPVLVTTLGGHQSARTIHFFSAIFTVLFVTVHLFMIWRAGFRRLLSGMITGRQEI